MGSSLESAPAFGNRRCCRQQDGTVLFRPKNQADRPARSAGAGTRPGRAAFYHHCQSHDERSLEMAEQNNQGGQDRQQDQGGQSGLGQQGGGQQGGGQADQGRQQDQGGIEGG